MRLARGIGAAVAFLALAGCGENGGATVEFVEGMINEQLPDQVKRDGGTFRSVSCRETDGDGREFDCTAQTTYDRKGVRLFIEASCDADSNCEWEVVGSDP